MRAYLNLRAARAQSPAPTAATRNTAQCQSDRHHHERIPCALEESRCMCHSACWNVLSLKSVGAQDEGDGGEGEVEIGEPPQTDRAGEVSESGEARSLPEDRGSQTEPAQEASKPGPSALDPS
eukprot:2428367-Rhodomonas_salina.1